MQLESLQSKKKRLQGGGRKAAHPEMEQELLQWIEALRAENLKISRADIQRKALELYQGAGQDEFVASKGWLEKFLDRNHLSLRRRTTVGQKLPRDLIPKVTSFIMKVRRIRHSKAFPLSSIGNMDETPLWLDMPGDTTITNSGARSVPIRTTGHEKGRFTVALSAMADGRKLEPFVIFKGVRPVKELSNIPGVVVAYSRNGWMNQRLTKNWVDRVWGTLNFGRRLLVWDAYKCHTVEDIATHIIRQTNTDVCLIPGGLTKLVQPADVSWNKAFKTAYKAKYSEWMASGQKSYTAAGNMRAPNKAQCLKWVKECWSSLSSELIQKSFRSCGISVNVDGSEDVEIHCLKAGQEAALAAPAITDLTRRLLQEDESDEDPFAGVDEEDEEELEQNELVIYTNSD